MTRTIDQIMADQGIEVEGNLVRTPETTIRPGLGWILQQYHWPDTPWNYNPHPVSPVAVAVLFSAVMFLFSSDGTAPPWWMPLVIGSAIGAIVSLVRSAIVRWGKPKLQPAGPNRGISFSIAGSEGSVTIFTSDDEQEIKLVRQKLEQTLLPAA